MKMTDSLAMDDILLDCAPRTKDELFQLIAWHFGPKTGLDRAFVADSLARREALGTTGIGGGVAIPHAAVPGLEKCAQAFLRLKPPIRFDAVDQLDVDLVFLILFPENDQPAGLKLLSRIARTVRKAEVTRGLRQAEGPDKIMSLLLAAEADPAG